MIRLSNAAMALMEAKFNVEFQPKNGVTVAILAVKEGVEITIEVVKSRVHFNSEAELIKHCNNLVPEVKVSGFELFRNDDSLFTFL